MTFKEQILKIKPYEYSKYSEIGLTKLGSVAVYFLHKNNIPLTYNYIGITMFKMFPDIFCCDDEFKEYPSLDRINREIIHMSITNSKKDEGKTKKPSILIGSAKMGYQITEYGISVALQTINEINHTATNISIKNANVDSHKQSTTKEYNTIKNSDEFKIFLKTKEAPKYSAWKIFGIKPFTQNSTVNQNIKFALNKAKELNDLELINFIQILQLQIN